jgi:hypothetical protein
MIDGFKLTITGEELRAHLRERVAAYREKADDLRRQIKEPDAECPLPAEMLLDEVERAEERAEEFEFMREHVVELEVYLLGGRDLQFVEYVRSDVEVLVPCGMPRD